MTEKNLNFERPIQLAKYQTSKKLVEATSRLKVGFPPAKDDKAYVLHHPWSKIGINVLDYSNGTGDKSVFASFNLNPEQCAYLFERIKGMMTLSDTKKGTFEYVEAKVIAQQKNDDGTSPASKLSIQRIPVGTDGTERRQPWVIAVENGTAIPEATQNGGTMAKKGSYKTLHKGLITLTDKDMFCFFYKIAEFINIWNISKGCSLIKLVEHDAEALKGGNK